jgi:glycosyltransferase 2 family protein
MSKFWKSTRRWLPGVLISMAAIAAILYFVDLGRFVDALRGADYRFSVAVLFIAMGWLAVRAIVWRTILRKRASYKDVFLTMCEGYLLNNFLPFRLGEIGRAFLLGRKTGLGFLEVLPSIIIERVLDLVFAAVILLCAVPFVVGAASAGQIALIIGGIVLAGLVALYFIARNQRRVLEFFQRLTKGRQKLQQRGTRLLESLFSGLSVLTDGWLFLKIVLWMTFNWAVAILQFYLLLRAFFPQVEPVWSLFALGAVAFGNAIPSLPGAIGTFEGAMAGALTIVSGNEAASLAAALTSHLINYLSTGVIGLIALSREGETLAGIYRQLRARQETTADDKINDPPAGKDLTA